jgi:L-lactate dehydrogenase complex protein LldG
MSSKTDILNRIRSHKLPAAAHPEMDADWIRFEDPESQFVDVVTSVGGQVAAPVDASQLREALLRLSCLADAKKIVCNVSEAGLGNCNLSDVSDPHELADVDVAIIAGEFAVAENGAIWVPDRGIKHRAILFLTQHLVLVVPRSAIDHNLHQAYERLRFDQAGYGVFISGPSKTADIEQSLVIGAHGPRSLTVILVTR